jgi:uncharacterized protein (TIGR03083 family)
MGQWDATTYEGKDTILRVVRDEADRFFALAEPSDRWEAPTTSTDWTTRDVVGHIIDTTEGYFAAFDAARGMGEVPDTYPLNGMAERANQQATSFQGVPQQEMLDRLRGDFQKMMDLLDALGPEEWTGLMVPHFYMGTLPAYFFAAGQLMDYGVHSWDIRQGTGRGHGLSADAADLLVPFMFVVWQSTVQADAEKTPPFDLGIRVGGRNGGDFPIHVDENGMTYERGSLDDLPTVLEFDAGSMVLTTFGRSNAGTVHGDMSIADRYLNLFFRI